MRTLYDMRRGGGITDAEARWILEIVLPEYGMTLADLAAWAAGGVTKQNGTKDA